ncbi:unnamed protein product [Caenorhabditis brenneri]
MVEIKQEWDLPLEVRGVPHFYKIELRHSVDSRRIFVNGTEKLFDSSKTASDGSSEDLIKIGGAKITIRIEKHDEDFVYSLEVNRQRAFGHTADILKKYFIFPLDSREAVILEKVNNKIFNNGELLNNKDPDCQQPAGRILQTRDRRQTFKSWILKVTSDADIFLNLDPNHFLFIDVLLVRSPEIL